VVQEQLEDVAISANHRELEADVAAENHVFLIPKRLDEQDRAMVVATQDDWARRSVTVYTVKCPCSGANFSKWDVFMRHVRVAEAHPHKMFFCDGCSDDCSTFSLALAIRYVISNRDEREH